MRPSRRPITIISVVHLYHCFRGRNKDVWGPDADEFRPERWFGTKEQVESPVGVYGNLYGHARSFCAGVEP